MVCGHLELGVILDTLRNSRAKPPPLPTLPVQLLPERTVANPFLNLQVKARMCGSTDVLTAAKKMIVPVDVAYRDSKFDFN